MKKDELRKSIRRLIWDTFIDTRLRTLKGRKLRKEEPSEEPLGSVQLKEEDIENLREKVEELDRWVKWAEHYSEVDKEAILGNLDPLFEGWKELKEAIEKVLGWELTGEEEVPPED